MRRRALLALAHGARSVCLLATFTGSLALGVSLHAGTPVFRRMTATIANEAMAGLFPGKVVVRDVQALSIGPTAKVHVREAEILDPDGHRVIVANDIDASIDLVRLLASLARTGAPDVELDDVHIGSSEVVLDVDASGTPLVARAFSPRPVQGPATPDTAPATPPPPPPEPRVKIRKARLARGSVHGNLVPPSLDGDVADVEASFDLEKDQAKIVVDRGRVTLRSPKAPNQKAPITGAVTGELGIDIATTALKGHADLNGACAGVPVVARASIDGEHVEATVDIARTEPAAVATAFSDIPLTKPVEIHAHAKGKLPTIGIDARVRTGESLADVNGEIDLREGHAFKLEIDASHLDAAAFGAGVATDISGKVTGEGTLAGGAGPLGTFRVTTNEGTVGAEKIPAATIEGRFESPRITAVVRAREPGIDANGKVTFDVTSKTATFDLQARSESLRALARIPNKLDGAGSARVQGTVDLVRGTIHGTATAAADQVGTRELYARHLTATGTVSGPLAAPVLAVGFAGVDMQVKATGKTPLVYPSASGHARVALAPTPRVLDASLDVTQPGSGGSISASAAGIRIDNGVVEARGMRVTGLGEPLELDARIGNGQWNVRAKSAGVDLHRAARITGIKELESLPEGTEAVIDVDLHQQARGTDGHVDIVVRSDKGLLGNGAVVAEVHATVERGKVVGTGKVAAEGFGVIEMTRAELDVPGRLDSASLRRSTGVVELRGTIDLSQGAALFAGENVERMSGIASFEARIERGDPKALPAIRGTVRTQGLEVALSGEPSSETFVVSGVDVLSHVAWDGRTDDAEVSFLSWDEHGLLGSAGAKAKVPLAAWASGAQKVDANVLAALEVHARADVPTRDVSELPPFLGAPPLRGKVDGYVAVSGKLGRPRVIVSAKANNVREDRRKIPGQRSFDPLDGTLEARWDGERAAITFALDERERRQRPPQRRDAVTRIGMPPPQRTPKRPGHVRGLVLLSDARMTDLLEGKTPAQLPWFASAEVEVENLALTALPFANGASGLLTGRVRVTDLNRDPSFEAKAHVEGFGAGGAKVQSLDVTAGGRDRSLFAHASIVDERNDEKTQGTFQLASKSLRMKGVSFGWDASAPTRLDYAIQNGRLALIAPLVKGSVSEIDGRVDGAGSATIDETSQVFEGGLALQSGRLYVNLLGEEISSLNATARFERTGTFRIDDATGKMGTGEFRASANGRMKGLLFMGADATLIATKDGIPISSEGATFAEATGEVKLSATMSEDRSTLLVAVDVPRADVQLPDRDVQELQSLDSDPTIAIGVRRPNGDLDTTAVRRYRGGTGKQAAATKSDGSPLVTRLNVALGNSVHLEGRGLDVTLAGRTVVELADELKVTGRIDLRGGTVEVHGRRFTVDHGTVTFPEGGEADNPTIIAAAYWDSPDRTRVWVEFTGPLKGGKIALRSEPPYSPNEILSVLLFGRPDPNMASASASSGHSGDSGATAVGTGFIAADINRALSEVDENLDVETDTLSGNRARAKVGRSFFDRRLKVQVGYAPGRTTYRDPDTSFVFLHWQFVPKWSLVATRGDRGTSILDVLFQHRY